MRLSPQHPLDIHLRAAVRQLGRAPRADQAPDDLARCLRRGQAQTRELALGIAVEIGDVGRIIGRQSLRAHLLGKAEPAIVLHGAGLGRIRRGKAIGCGSLLQHDRGNAAASELNREHQTARSRSDDDDGAIPLLAHAASIVNQAPRDDGPPAMPSFRGAASGEPDIHASRRALRAPLGMRRYR